MQIIATSDAHVARNRHRDKLVYIVVGGGVAGFVCFLIVVGDGSGWRLTATPHSCLPYTPACPTPLQLPPPAAAPPPPPPTAAAVVCYDIL